MLHTGAVREDEGWEEGGWGGREGRKEGGGGGAAIKLLEDNIQIREVIIETILLWPITFREIIKYVRRTKYPLHFVRKVIRAE